MSDHSTCRALKVDKMSIAYLDHIPQGSNPPIHSKVDGKLYRRVEIARDPLTCRAYFDAVDISFHPSKILEIRERAMSRKDWRYAKLDVHADVLKIKVQEAITGLSTSGTGATGELRSLISGFSRQSRKRMIEFMAKTRVRGQLLFATFTYPDEFPIVYRWNEHFEALRRRIEREYPGFSIIWRKELKERKSGKSVGKVAPHWHMVIDTGNSGELDIRVDKYRSYGKLYDKTTSPVSRNFEDWALNAWSEIVGSNDVKHSEHGCFVVACRNKKHAFKYVSKYVAKEDNDNYTVGRRWGRIGQWDTSSSESLFLTKKEYIELMRLVTRWLKSKGRDYGKVLARANRAVGCAIFGIGDVPVSQEFLHRLFNHAAELSGEIPPFD